MDTEQLKINITSTVESYIENIYTELKDRWNNWEKDLTQKELYEVVGGILSRQVAIMTNFASSSNLWNGDIAPLILRSMADNYINLAWILKDPLKRSQQFILHGLGQAKLTLEHRRKQLELDGIDPKNDPSIDATDEWINSQRYTFFTEVNLGSWSGLNTRVMAEEAGCIDFYNHVYQPFSSASHNMWNHISRYNLIQSDNPLHKFLLIPSVHKFDPDIWYFELGAKYVEKLFVLFDKNFNHTQKSKSSYDIVFTEINNIKEKIKSTGKHNHTN